jgi:bla regulator protein BlaR1
MAYSSFNWLIENQLLLSSLLLSFILLERFCLKLLKPDFVYKLVCLIPLAMVLANLPSTMKPFKNNSIGYYLIKPNIDFVNDFGFTWLNIYLLVTTLLLTTAFVIHLRFVKSLRLIPVSRSQQQHIEISGDIFTSPSINSPMVVGIFKSTLVLPSAYEKQFSVSALALIIEHESIHMRRKDNLVNAVFLMSTIFVWFNPLAWLAYASFRLLQELSCDQKVLQNKTLEQQILYSKALIDCAASAPNRMMAYSHYGDKKMILQRLTNIKRDGKGSGLAKGGLLLAAGLMLSSLVIAQPTAIDKSIAKDVRPIERVPPVYPAHAVEQGLTGVVTLKYDITTAGIPTNISVVSAKPERIFNREAKKALAQWKYNPSAQGHQDVLVQLEFALD